MKLTKVRRIEGDVNALRTELQEALGLEQKEVVINQLTKYIIVKVCLFCHLDDEAIQGSRLID